MLPRTAPRKAIGEDGIRSEVLALSSEATAEYLADAFDQLARFHSSDLARRPLTWRSARVVILPKRSHPSLKEHFREIILLGSVHKL